MKILFLDIDGVLNSRAWNYTNSDARFRDDLSHGIDPAAVARLNQIVLVSKCRVVLSSAWRCLDPIAHVNRALRGRGFVTHLLGATPSLGGDPRGHEIKTWLELVEGVYHFVILDDDSDMDSVQDHLVQTNYELGLRSEHVLPALKLLGVEGCDKECYFPDCTTQHGCAGLKSS